MVKKKVKSKRMSCSKKYKIVKKVAEHNRKERSNSKKTGPASLRSKTKKDPGIPSMWPYKGEVLAELEEAKQRMAAKAEAKKTADKERRARDLAKKRNMPAQQQMLMMQADAAKRGAQFDDKEEFVKLDVGSGLDLPDQSRRQFYKEFRKTVEVADVILEVLDARDPLGCRTPAVERMILNTDPNKKIVLILNKIDLIPKENVEAWLKYLRNEYPTVAFKASTQKQTRNLGHAKIGTNVASSDILGSSECLGGDTLLQLLKNYTRNQNIKTAITVGVIGYPNVGKSSLINSLKRSKVANVGSTPGVTKVAQEIHLDSKVKLLDCPGIVFATGNAAEVVLRNCVKVEQLDDPVSPIEGILKRCEKEKLMALYRIPSFEDHLDFLRHVALKRGRVQRGGIADTIGAARIILQDWNAGKIKYYTNPPTRASTGHDTSEVVAQWGKAFDVDSVINQEKSLVIKELAQDGGDFMALESGGMCMDELEVPPEDDDLMSDDDEMDDGEEEYSDDDDEGDDEMEDIRAAAMTKTKPKSTVPKPDRSSKVSKKNMKSEDDEFNPQSNKSLKAQQKKAKKDAKRGLAPSTKPASDAYDFGEHYDDADDIGDDDDEGMQDDDEDLDDVDESD